MCVELLGDVGDKEKPLANLLLEELNATYEYCEPFKTTTQVCILHIFKKILWDLYFVFIVIIVVVVVIIIDIVIT